jgi:hypothetical protein
MLKSSQSFDNFAGRVRCPGHDVVVLLQQVRGLPGLHLLSVAKEVQPSVHPARGPPRYHALHRLVGHQVTFFIENTQEGQPPVPCPPCTWSTTGSCPSPPGGASGNFFHRKHARRSAICPPCTWSTAVSCPSPPGGASGNFFIDYTQEVQPPVQCPPCTWSTTGSCPSPPGEASGNVFHRLHARSSATCPPCTWFTTVSCPSPPGGASGNFFHRLHARSSAICQPCTWSTTGSCPSPPGGASGNVFLLDNQKETFASTRCPSSKPWFKIELGPPCLFLKSPYFFPYYAGKTLSTLFMAYSMAGYQVIFLLDSKIV